MRLCLVPGCGRKFENDETMLEHVRRRHPEHYDIVKTKLNKSVIDAEHNQQQEMAKLPKLAKIMAQGNKINQIHKRSSSKEAKEKNKIGGISSIIEDSRKLVSDNKTTKRPSLKKKSSLSELNEQKLPPLSTMQKNRIQLSIIQKPKLEEEEYRAQTQKDFYKATQPNKNASNKRPRSFRSKSKESKTRKTEPALTKTEQVAKSISQSQINKTLQQFTHTNESQIRSHFRPTRKNIEKKKQSGKNEEKQKQEVHKKIQDYNFEERTVSIKEWNKKNLTCPPFAKVEMLFLNNCGLQMLELNELESLVQLSATYNHLHNMEFLRHKKNKNIRFLHLDHNEIEEVYLPPNTKVLTLSFNKVGAENIEGVCSSIRKSPLLEEIDFSFNPVRKALNYKMKILVGNKKLKSIDGLKVTKIDHEMVSEYRELYAKEKGLIPLGSPGKQRPSTAISELTYDDFENEKKIEQLEEDSEKIEKIIKRTNEQLKLIQVENQILQDEINILEKDTNDEDEGIPSIQLYEKLKRECEILEAMDFLKWADNQELKVMLQKKHCQLSS